MSTGEDEAKAQIEKRATVRLVDCPKGKLSLRKLSAGHAESRDNKNTAGFIFNLELTESDVDPYKASAKQFCKFCDTNVFRLGQSASIEFAHAHGAHYAVNKKT